MERIKVLLRNIFLILLGIFSTFLGAAVNDPANYGAVDPLTIAGQLTIAGTILFAVGCWLLIFDIFTNFSLTVKRNLRNHR